MCRGIRKILFPLLFYRATLMYRYAYFRYMYMNTLTGSWNNLALFGSNPFLKPINPSIYPFINNHLFLWKIFIILQKITISLYLKNPLSLASRNIQAKIRLFVCVRKQANLPEIRIEFPISMNKHTNSFHLFTSHCSVAK